MGLFDNQPQHIESDQPLLPRTRPKSRLNLIRIVFFLHLISVLACGALAIHATKSTVEHRELLELLPPGLNYVLLATMVLCPVAMVAALRMSGRTSSHERFKLLAAEAGMSAMQLFFFFHAFQVG